MTSSAADTFIHSLKRVLHALSDDELASRLSVGKSTIASWRRRGIPKKVKRDLSSRYFGIASEPGNDDTTLADRMGALLADIWDAALVVLPSHGPGELADPLELRLGHFRPDLSERMATLLEEAGL